MQTSFEGLWSAVFRLAGSRLRRRGARPPAVPRLAADGGGAAQRVLIVAPHPDDEVAGCAGTLLTHRDVV